MFNMMILSSEIGSNPAISFLIIPCGSSGFLTSFILKIKKYSLTQLLWNILFMQPLPLGTFMVKYKLNGFPVGQFFGNDKVPSFSFINF